MPGWVSPTEQGPVLIASILRTPGPTGVQAHVGTLEKGIAGAGFGCVTVTPFSGGHAWLPVFAVRPLLLSRLKKSWSTRWHRHWHLVALRRNLARAVRRWPPAAMIAEDPLAAKAALDSRETLGGSFPIAAVCHFNVSQAKEWRDKGELDDKRAYTKILRLEEEVLERVDHVVYVSSWARETIERDRRIRPRSSAVIWNGLAPLPPPTTGTREEFGLAEDDVVLINIGTLEPRKNQIGLVEAFARLHERFPVTKLLLIGDGPDRRRVERRIADLRITDSVRLLGYRRNAASYLGLADVYVHYAAIENLPLVLLEAARAGLPSAAPPVGGIAELQPRLGGSVPLASDDPDASAEALGRLVGDSAVRDEMGRLAYARFLENFTEDAMVSAYLRLFGLERATASSVP